jgi:hypothetical protein
VKQGDELSSQGEWRRPPRRPWQALGIYLITLSGLVGLMHGVPWLDPARYEGRLFGTLMTFGWCLSLLVWALGVVRRYGSRFTLRTLVILTAVVAVYLGLCRTVSPFIPTTVGAAGLSVMMLYEAQRCRADAGTGPEPYRGWVSRAIMALGGLLFLAHFSRLWGLAALISLGVLRQPG